MKALKESKNKSSKLACYLVALIISLKIAVIFQFLLDFFPLMELARFTSFLLQWFASHLATLIDSRHSLSLDQSSLSSPALAFFGSHW